MSNDLSLFDGAIPAHIQAAQSTGLTNAIADTIGGEAVPSIGLKGSRFRMKEGATEVGVRDETYLDVVIVASAPAISRIFYSQSYGSDEHAKPACFSADGLTPSAESESPQCGTCQLCPQNQKGSRMSDSGQPTKACSYYRRIGVMLLGDPDNKVYRLDIKSQGLFGDGVGNAKSFNDYIKFLKMRNAELTSLVTRITFDTNSSVPKLLFQALRYITGPEYDQTKLRDKDAAARAVMIEYKSEPESLHAEYDIPGVNPMLDAPAAPAAPKPAAPAAPKAKKTTPTMVAPPPVEADHDDVEVVANDAPKAKSLADLLADLDSF